MGLYLIIMGVQGAGKGTQAARLKEAYDIPHVSTGDLFRAMRNRSDDLAVRVQTLMNSGQLVPDDTTNDVLQDRLEQPDAAERGAVLDGYPRNIAQAEWLEHYLSTRGEQLAAVILLELDSYTAFKRAYGRLSSPSTGESYNIYTNADAIDWQMVEHPDKAYPPRIEGTLKATGEALKRRPDDEAAAVVQRIDTYMAQTAPLIDHYREKGLLVSIDARQSIEDVTAAIKAAVEERVNA